MKKPMFLLLWPDVLERDLVEGHSDFRPKKLDMPERK